jgi:Na+-transporting NADH:ubiquinone oxidoreductase subunit C
VSSNDSVGKIIGVAFALCIVCSVIVSAAAVMLKPAQEANKDLDRKRNILAAAGMLEEGAASRSCSQRSSRATWICAAVRFAEEVPAGYDQRTRQGCHRCPPDLGDADIAKIGAARISPRCTWSAPARAKAALRQDYPAGARLRPVVDAVRLSGPGVRCQHVAGLGFYEHGETPGLGGEVDNPRWKASGRASRSTATATWSSAAQGRRGPRQRRRGVAASTASPGQP